MMEIQCSCQLATLLQLGPEAHLLLLAAEVLARHFGASLDSAKEGRASQLRSLEFALFDDCGMEMLQT